VDKNTNPFTMETTRAGPDPRESEPQRIKADMRAANQSVTQALQPSQTIVEEDEEDPKTSRWAHYHQALHRLLHLTLTFLWVHIK
jgi:hypothetical protein